MLAQSRPSLCDERHVPDTNGIGRLPKENAPLEAGRRWSAWVSSQGRQTNQLKRQCSSALRIAAVQTGHAAVHQHDGGGAALAAQLRAFGEVALCKGVLLFVARLVLGLLFLDEL